MSLGKVVSDFLFRGAPSSDVVTETKARRGYLNMSSILGHLPYLDTVNENSILLAQDGRSMAAVYSIKPIPTEGRSDALLEQFASNFNNFICNTFEEHATAPWVVQFYAWNDKTAFYDIVGDVRNHAQHVHRSRDATPEPFTDWFIDNVFEPHIKDMMEGNGLFVDNLSDQPWGGQRRRVYMVFYRLQEGAVRRRNMTPEFELENQCKKVEQMLRAAGCIGSRLKGEAIRNWLFRWFNPAPKVTQGNTEALLKHYPYIPETKRTEEFVLSADIVTNNIRSDEKTKNWYFDDMPHTVLTVERLDAVPDVGQISAERYRSKEERSSASAKTVCMLDELPKGSILNLVYVVKPQQRIRKHLERLEKNSKGSTPEARAAREEVAHARMQIARGNKLYPYSMNIMVRGRDDDHLDDVIQMVNTVLVSNNFKIIDSEYDLFRLDRYMRCIPCGFNPELAQLEMRNRLVYTDHLASLLPFYGRGLGTGNPGQVHFNRGGEPVCFDPTYSGDRVKNGHLFLFGPTGSGKSSTLVYLLMYITAIINPRWVVIEAGNSFGLLSEFLRRMGKSTVDIVLRPGKGCPSIAPFKSALQLVDEHGRVLNDFTEVEDVLAGDAELPFADDGSEEAELDTNSADHEAIDASNRDILGELLIIARLMVTGGEANEEKRMSRADMGLLKIAILNAASQARLQSKEDVLTEDVASNLIKLADERPENRKRILEMTDAMQLFCSGFAGQLFNRPGEELPDADFIRVEMASLAAGNDANDKLAVAYISIINQVIARAQKTQREARPTINLTDEAHVITTNSLLATYLVVVSKLLGRRMGLWLWQATQNMDDYVNEAKKMLAMFEWWICLKIEAKELEKIAENRVLSDDQKSMLLSMRKQPQAYTEGVVMSDTVQNLFRVVLPPLCFVLAGTELEEKRARMHAMKLHKCDEVNACILMAKELSEKRRNNAIRVS